MTDDHERDARALRALALSVDELLDPPGCEWNRAQDARSLVTYLVEETFELVEAIEAGDETDLREELGDVLYQVVLQAAVAERAGAGFALADVIADVDDKTRRRHPHVFGDDEARDVDDIIRLWSAEKAREKASRTSAYDGVPLGMPALARAQKLLSRQARAHDGGAEPSAEGAQDHWMQARVPQESGEHGHEHEHEPAETPSTEVELGHALLAMVEAASAQGLDAERALRAAVREREVALRDAERARREERERRGTPQPE